MCSLAKLMHPILAFSGCSQNEMALQATYCPYTEDCILTLCLVLSDSDTVRSLLVWAIQTNRRC